MVQISDSRLTPGGERSGQILAADSAIAIDVGAQSVENRIESHNVERIDVAVFIKVGRFTARSEPARPAANKRHPLGMVAVIVRIKIAVELGWRDGPEMIAPQICG